jgi:hypothetical protein
VPLDLGARTLLYFVVDADSPSQWSGWGDLFIPLTPAEVAALPTGLDTIKATIEGSVTTIPGIRRTVNGRLEWLIRPLPDPVLVMFNALPGPGGWTDPAAKATWANIGQILLSKGVTPAELISGFPALFNAARDEIL